MFNFLGFVLLLLGIAGKLWIGRRKFYRRNQAGVEGFENYREAITANVLEGAINVVSGVSLIIGLLLFIFGGFFN